MTVLGTTHAPLGAHLGVVNTGHWGIRPYERRQWSDSDDLEALLRLWTAAASQVHISHLVPKVETRLLVARGFRAVDIRLANFRLPNTDNPDYDAGGGSFGMVTRVQKWPGYKVAKLYLAAAHATLAHHEALECVFEADSYRARMETPYPTCTSGDRIACPHFSEWGNMSMTWVGHSDSGDFQLTLEHIMPPDRARRLIESEAARADVEMINEIAAGDWPE